MFGPLKNVIQIQMQCIKNTISYRSDVRVLFMFNRQKFYHDQMIDWLKPCIRPLTYLVICHIKC